MELPNARIYCETEEDVASLFDLIEEDGGIVWGSGGKITLNNLLDAYNKGYQMFTVTRCDGSGRMYHGMRLKGDRSMMEDYEIIENLFNIPITDYIVFLEGMGRDYYEVDFAPLTDLL